eukprot:6284063-Amphidinium_carterae.1
MSTTPGRISSNPGKGPALSVCRIAAPSASDMSCSSRAFLCSLVSSPEVGRMTSTENRDSSPSSVVPLVSETERLPEGVASGSGSPDAVGTTLTSP